jgi:hypothetical protein
VKDFISIPKNVNMRDFAFFIVFWCHQKFIKLSYDIEMVNKPSFSISIICFEFWRENGVILLQTMIIMSPFPTY